MSSSSKMHYKDAVSVDQCGILGEFMGIYLLTFTKFSQWFGICYFLSKKRRKFEKEGRGKNNKAN